MISFPSEKYRQTSFYCASQLLCIFFTNCGSVVTLLWVTIFRAPFSISICSLCVCITFWECLQFSNFSLLSYLLWGQQLVNFDLTIIIIGAFFSKKIFLN